MTTDTRKGFIPSPAEADAPGSLFLMGEYAVLEGGRAVLMTLRHRLRVSITPAESFRVTSDRFGVYAGEGGKPQHVVLCENILRRFLMYRHPRASGGDAENTRIHISITSAIPPDLGFASSGALVGALTKALFRAFDMAENFIDMFAIGHAAIHDTFGRGSGADVAAALADMPFLVFDPQSCTVAPFTPPFVVQAVYTGYKTTTPAVLKRVHEMVSPLQWAEVIAKMKTCTDTFIAVPSMKGVEEYQGYMNTLGVTCESSDEIIALFGARGVTAKISGAGMGDCIVGFTDTPLSVLDTPLPYRFLPQKELQA